MEAQKDIEKKDGNNSPVETLVRCKCVSLPSLKYYNETQFSTIKTRRGKEEVAFMGLDPGVHKITFYTEKRSVIRDVKIWYSPYGWAWIIKKPTTKKTGRWWLLDT